MDLKNVRKNVISLLLFTVVSTISAALWAQTPAVDPAAVNILHRMTSYVGSLEKFSLHTENTLEEVFDSGQRIDFDIAANMVVKRPNKLFTERVGEETGQAFYYDGETLSMVVESPSEAIYASLPAPGTIEELIDYARESLGIVLPVSDLVYRNAQSILMKGVTSAMYMGETQIGDMNCSHLAFRRPDIDFQVWVSTGDQPLPCKYVVTDTSTPALVSIVTVMSHWQLTPAAADEAFLYVPTEGAKSTVFLPLESGSDR
jgi:hypothetical protein